jgi:hypothetical protein
LKNEGSYGRKGGVGNMALGYELDYKFQYFEYWIVHSCDDCRYCIKGLCEKNIPGPGKNCGGNSVCAEWEEKPKEPKVIFPWQKRKVF